VPSTFLQQVTNNNNIVLKFSTMKRPQASSKENSNTTRRVKSLIEQNRTKNMALKKLLKRFGGPDAFENNELKKDPNK